MKFGVLCSSAKFCEYNVIVMGMFYCVWMLSEYELAGVLYSSVKVCKYKAKVMGTVLK